jgi:hypothetical protein
MPDRLTTADVGCWVIKTRLAPDQILPGWRPDSTRSLTRCLRRSYRLELMAPGQPCLLWLSGRQNPGVHAIGTVTGKPGPALDRLPAGDPDVDRAQDPAVSVSLHLLQEPVERQGLLADPLLAGSEVLRMPAGSNPSFLSPQRLSALLDLVSPHDLATSGWAELQIDATHRGS